MLTTFGSGAGTFSPFQGKLTTISLHGGGMAAEEGAVTLADAAAALGVSPQRISQLIRAGVLNGPRVSTGARSAPGSPRVYVSSLAEELTRRALPEPRARQGSRVAALESTVEQVARELSELRQGLVDRERAAREAAVELKASADALLEQLLAQIDANAALSVEAATNKAMLAAAGQKAQAIETARAATSGALGTLIGPAGPHDIGAR